MKIREETQKQKLKCLTLCNVDVQNMESKLIEQSGETQDTSTREDEVRH